MNEKTLVVRSFKHEMLIGAFLAVTGGFLDAYTYIFRDGVFANAQTGNMVMLGISAAKGDFYKAGYYFIPIAAFFLGVLATEYLKRHQSLGSGKKINWVHITLITEAVLLFVIGFIPKQVPSAYVNVVVSFVCSLQVNAFKKIADLPYATTMCTGNLRSASEQLSLLLFEKKPQAGKNCVIYFFIITLFCVGAVLGAVFTAAFNEKSVWLCCAMLLFVLSLMLSNN